MELSREIRCWFAATPPSSDLRPANSWSGWLASDDLNPFVVLRLTVAGQPDQRTGMLCDIQELDGMLRASVLAVDRRCGRSMSLIARDLWLQLTKCQPLAAKIVRLELAASPYLRYGASVELLNMVTITQQFEFSAAHRLHCEQLSVAENQSLFGKCNNPHGHGHNYVLEVTIAGTTESESAALLTLPELDRRVRSMVIDRLDHRNLNLEIAEFADLNPTVEQIARLIWKWLKAEVAPAKLHQVRVYETPKTWADVFASDEIL